MTNSEYIAIATTDLLAVAERNAFSHLSLENVRYSYCSTTHDFDCSGDLVDDHGRPIMKVTSERFL